MTPHRLIIQCVIAPIIKSFLSYTTNTIGRKTKNMVRAFHGAKKWYVAKSKVLRIGAKRNTS